MDFVQNVRPWPVSKTVVAKCKSMADAGGGDFVLLASAGKGFVGGAPLSWCASVLVRNRVGETVVRGISGALYVLMCKLAAADFKAQGSERDFAAAANSGISPALKAIAAGSKVRKPDSPEEALQE